MNGERKKTKLIETAGKKEQENLQVEKRGLGKSIKDEDIGYLNGDK
jgi:hypothetical protein